MARIQDHYTNNQPGIQRFVNGNVEAKFTRWCFTDVTSNMHGTITASLSKLLGHQTGAMVHLHARTLNRMLYQLEQVISRTDNQL